MTSRSCYLDCGRAVAYAVQHKRYVTEFTGQSTKVPWLTDAIDDVRSFRVLHYDPTVIRDVGLYPLNLMI